MEKVPTPDEVRAAQAEITRITNWPEEEWKKRPPEAVKRENERLEEAQKVINAYREGNGGRLP